MTDHKELIEVCRAHERNLNNGFPFTSQMGADFQEALNALEAHAEQVAIVKPLEWKPTTIDGKHLRDTARDMDGRLRYLVGVIPGHHYLIILLPQGDVENLESFPNEESAKAAADAHNRDRILSAINLRPEAEIRADERAKVIEKAARICTGDTERPDDIPAAKMRKLDPIVQFAHQQLLLAWQDADAIRALHTAASRATTQIDTTTQP